MATQRVRPDPSVLDRQREVRRTRNKQRKVGVFVVTALVVGGGIAAAFALNGSSPESIDRSTGTEPVAPEGDVLFIDVATGEVSSGPELGPEVDHVAVSPDGTKVAYISWEGAGPEIVFVAGIDGSNVRSYPTTRSPDAARTPAWSPDGSTIVYQAKGVGSKIVGDLFLLDVASGEVRQLTNLGIVSDEFMFLTPSFASSGDAVLFTAPTEATPPRLHLWSVPVTGGGPTLIRRNAVVGEASPNAERFTFLEPVRVDGENAFEGLWIADIDGSDVERLVDGSVSFSRWSPDGTRILYGDEGDGKLMILDPATGETMTVDSTLAVDSAPAGADWLDNGTLMVDGSPEL